MLKVALEKEGSKVRYGFKNHRRRVRLLTSKLEQHHEKKGVFTEETLKSMVHQMVCLEQGVFELRMLFIDCQIESALTKAKELTGLAAKAGSSEAMKICIAIQLVGRQGLLQRAFELVEELLAGVKSFKENLMMEGA